MSSARPTWAHKMIADAINDPAPLLSKLDSENDELAVREHLASGKYNGWQADVVNEWLRRKIDGRQAEAEAQAEVRAEKALSIALEANLIARSQADAAWRAARYAMYAAVIAVIAALASSKDQIFALFFGVLN